MVMENATMYNQDNIIAIVTTVIQGWIVKILQTIQKKVYALTIFVKTAPLVHQTSQHVITLVHVSLVFLVNIVNNLLIHVIQLNA